MTFLVDRDGDVLTLELPEQLGGVTVRLYAAEERNAFTAAESVRVVFDRDANGHISALSLYASNSEMFVASKAPPPRGIVTIQDLSGGVDYASSARRDGVHSL